MTDFAITIKGLKKSYKKTEVLKGVDFDVQRGEIFTLLGSNGARKTTIVKILLQSSEQIAIVRAYAALMSFGNRKKSARVLALPGSLP